ncbi:ABC transporter ATP-binding protein [Celerinatantimonas sp. YJH-8]|uniref:ABC transporter ATP-binding protein n=1 Tax=Celerinatantimonas sp. YJH-8 TaxID=3228714 RepID=UPI0038C821EB
MRLLQLFQPLFALIPKIRIGLLLMLMILTSLTEGIGILLLVPLLQSLQTQHSSHSWIEHVLQWLGHLGIHHSTLVLMTVLFTLIVLKAGLQYARERQGMQLQQQLVDSLRSRIFQALLHVEWSWLVQQRRSDHAATLLTDVSRVGNGFNFLLSLMSSLTTLGIYLIVAFGLSWPVTLLALFSAIILMGLLSGQRRRALNLGQDLSRANQRMQATVDESLTGIKLAKILRREAHFFQQFQSAMSTLRQKQLDFQSDTSLSKALFQVGGAALLMGYLWAGLKIWHLDLTHLLTLVIVFSRMIPLCMSAHQQLHHCLHTLPALSRAHQQLQDYQHFAEPLSESLSLNFEHEIRFNHVTYRYPNTQTAALSDISVTLPIRTTTAIIGHSGSGKSTLADLLMGLLIPTAGEIQIDQQPLDHRSRLGWRSQVAYVPQDVFLFHESIRANLLLAQPKASDAQLWQALNDAAADFVMHLPEGLDTQIGDGGIRLSGGERQRLALARALLQRPALLILDEATSALDVANEHRIRQALEHLHGDLTVVIIGHRLATLEHADQVLKLDHGKLAAQGHWQDMNAQQDTL